jgi:hypothetical protein
MPHDFDKRELRARHFVNMIMGVMCDYLPRGQDFLRRIYDDLYKTAYEGNLEIINVPPECDALDKLQLERLRLETHPMFLKDGEVIPGTTREKQSQNDK